MASEIGYGAAVIKAGEVKYQQALVNMMKQAAQQADTNQQSAQQSAKSQPPEHAGKNVDISA
jgi:hypothetical protein